MKKYLRTRWGIFDMRWSAKRTPRIDGGRWFVRVGDKDIYTKTFVQAAVLRFLKRHAATA